MEGTNSFEKGLHRSNSPVEQPDGSYVDAYNWIRNDSGRLINEDLENIVYNFSEETVLLGHCPIRNEFICFLKTYNYTDNIWNSVIATFSDGVYIEIFNDKNHTYKLGFTNDIDCVARIVSSGSRVVYFVEENNPIRRFDLDEYLVNPNLYNGYEDFNLQLTVKYPKLSTLIGTNGTLNASSYSFVIRYRDNNNNKTQWGIPSRMLSIIPGNSSLETDQGGAPNTTTNKNIQITLENSDLNFPLIEIAVIKYEGTENIKIVKSLGLYKNDSKIVVDYTNDSQLGESIDLTSVNDVPIYYDSAKCIEQKDNILLISNLTVKRYDSDFQEIANKIIVTTYIEKVPIDIKRGINVRGYDVSSNTSTNKIGFGSVDEYLVLDQWYGRQGSGNPIDDNYNNTTNLYKDPNFKKGFQPDEVYSFSITPIYKDGSIGFAYHIPCTKDSFSGYKTINSITYNYTKSYISSLLYPVEMDMGSIGPNIRHHKMPSINLTSVDNTSEGNFANILRVKFFNINIPLDVQAKIQGYIIGYQQRNSDLNTSIIDEGIAVPYNFWKEDNQYYNGVLNGKVQFVGDDNSLDPTADEEDNDTVIREKDSIIANRSPYAMFYSPSTQIGLEIKEGYKFQIHREAMQHYWNTRATATNKLYNGASILRHISDYGRSWTYDAFFFDGNQTISANGVPASITNVSRNNGDFDSSKSNIINNKFVIGGGTNFTHIETSAQELWSYNMDNNIWIVGYYLRTANDANKIKRVVKIWYIDSQNQTTSIGRVTNPIPNQYGNIYDAKYLVAETVLDPSQKEVEVEGDTYTFKHWFNIRSIHKQKIAGNEKQFNFDFVAGVWLTSQNNFALRHREAQDASYYPQNKSFFTVEDNPEMFSEYWYYRSLGYNKQYSALNNNKLNFPKPLLFSENNVFTNRTIYSKQAFESELSDQYRDFPYGQFHDIPKDRGAITDTFVFNNNLFIHTEYGLWQAYFNPNTTQATSQGEIVLGNAGIFTIPSKLVLDIKGGYMGTLDKSGINTPFGRIFIDHSQKKIFLFDGASPVEISDLGLFSFFREYIDLKRKYAIGYDWRNKRILISNNKINISDIKNDLYYFDYFMYNTTRNNAKDLGFLETKNALSTYSSYNAFPISPIVWLKFKLDNISNIIINATSQYNSILKIYTVNSNNQLELINSYNLSAKDVFNPNPTFISKINLDRRMTNINLNLDKGEYYISFESSNQTQRNTRSIKIMSVYSSLLTISYYPKTQTWTSFHSFAPSSYLTINSSSYAWNNNSFFNLYNNQGVKKSSYITFVENASPDNFKRFDKMEINTMSGGEEIFGSSYPLSPGSVLNTNYKFLDKSFTNIHCWTDRQNSTELDLEYSHDFNTNFLNGYDVNKVPVNYYRGSFHLELPLDAVIDPYSNIFNSNNLNKNAEFKSYLKGKFLYTKLSYNNDKPLVLNYVKTFFKPSVA